MVEDIDVRAKAIKGTLVSRSALQRSSNVSISSLAAGMAAIHHNADDY